MANQVKKEKKKSPALTFLQSGGKLFKQAFLKTRRQMLTSVVFLIVLIIIFAFLMYFAEHWQNSNFGFWDALKWNFVKTVGDPAEVAESPVTGFGKIVGTLVGVLGVAIFAVPAGLIGSGLIDAMDDEKRENELKELRERIRKAFRRDKDKLFSDYLKVKDDLYFVPQEIPVYKLQARQNMDLKDIIDCCKEYPEIRLKNMAQLGTTIEDLFVVEQAYLNRCYGACVDRKSRVTIVSTSSYAEKGTGWFAYYLALFGNFNFISKDVEVDVDDQDPFYNLNPKPRHDMKTLDGLNEDERSDKKLVEKLTLKQAYRNAYFNDLYDCYKDRQGSWFIVIKEHKTSDPDDRKIYLTAHKKDGSLMMIDDATFYNALCQDFSELMKTEEELDVVALSDLYSLKDNYVINQMKKQHTDVSCNSFVMRPASDVMNNARKLIVAHRIARFLSAKLDSDREMCLEELKEEGFGFKQDPQFEILKKKAEEEAKMIIKN